MYSLITDCPDCVNNIDLTDKNNILACVITIGIGAIIRWLEKRHDKKRRNNSK